MDYKIIVHVVWSVCFYLIDQLLGYSDQKNNPSKKIDMLKAEAAYGNATIFTSIYSHVR